MNGIKYKRPSDSVTTKTEVVCPYDTNPLGLLKGGRLVEWMDMIAAGCAQIHTGRVCVTAAIHHIDFYKAAHSGDIVSIRARMTRVFNSSMEIIVQAYTLHVKSSEKSLISEAYFTFVALNDNGNAVKVIAVKPVSATEKKKYGEALLRKKTVSDFKKKTKCL